MKDTFLKVRISTERKEAIRQAAEKAGVTMTDFVVLACEELTEDLSVGLKDIEELQGLIL